MLQEEVKGFEIGWDKPPLFTYFIPRLDLARQSACNHFVLHPIALKRRTFWTRFAIDRRRSSGKIAIRDRKISLSHRTASRLSTSSTPDHFPSCLWLLYGQSSPNIRYLGMIITYYYFLTTFIIDNTGEILAIELNSRSLPYRSAQSLALLSPFCSSIINPQLTALEPLILISNSRSDPIPGSVVKQSKEKLHPRASVSHGKRKGRTSKL